MYDSNIQAVSELLSLEFYRFKRYKIPITLVFVQIDDKRFYDIAESSIRKTDLFQQIDKHLYAIIYTHTDASGAGMAVKNIFETLKVDSESYRVVIEEAGAHDATEQELVMRAYGVLMAG